MNRTSTETQDFRWLVFFVLVWVFLPQVLTRILPCLLTPELLLGSQAGGGRRRYRGAPPGQTPDPPPPSPVFRGGKLFRSGGSPGAGGGEHASATIGVTGEGTAPRPPRPSASPRAVSGEEEKRLPDFQAPKPVSPSPPP